MPHVTTPAATTHTPDARADALAEWLGTLEAPVGASVGGSDGDQKESGRRAAANCGVLPESVRDLGRATGTPSPG
jgi:hypothetical protein